MSNKATYESHFMADPKLPFIFHTDTGICNTNKSDLDNCKAGEPIFSLNWHENIEILQFLSGTALVKCGTNVISVEKGNTVVIEANKLHGVWSANGAKYHCLIIDKDFCLTNGITTDKLCFYELIKDAEIEKKFTAIIDGFNNKGMFSEAKVRCAVLDLMVFLCEKYANVNENKSVNIKKLENINTAIGYIEANLFDKLTLEDIAFQISMSKYHFAREFKRITGETVFTYINLKRCETAKKLLSNENYSITEIAEQCGYDNYSYFSETFKKYTGQTPSQFRSL